MVRNKVDTEMYKALGRILKSAREKQHMSLRELSDALGGTKSKSTIKRYEDGTVAMTTETLSQICSVLHIDPSNAVETAYQMIGSDDNYRGCLYGLTVKKEEKLLAAYREAPSYVKEVVDRLLKIDGS